MRDQWQAISDRGGQLVGITDGETDPDQEQWIMALCRQLLQHLGVPLFGDRDGTRYWHYVRRMVWNLSFYRRRINRALREKGLPELKIAKRAKDNYRNFVDLRSQGGPEVFVVGVPSPLAIALLAGVPWLAGAIADQLSAELEKITDDPRIDNDSLAFSLELPIDGNIGAGFGLAPAPLARRLTRWSMQWAWRVVESLPSGTKIIFHGCGGDLGGKRLLPWHFVAGWVRFFNTAVRDLPVGYPVYCIHFPLGAGQKQPVLAGWRLRALRRLQVPAGTIVAFGIGHKHQSAERAAAVRRAVTAHTQPITRRAWASMCGLRRHDADEAARVCEQLVEAD